MTDEAGLLRVGTVPLREAAQRVMDSHRKGYWSADEFDALEAALAIAQVPEEEREPCRATADQEERAKWRANERADRLAAALSDLAYIAWGSPSFPYPRERAGADGIVWTSPESVRSLLDEALPAQEERLDVERLMNALHDARIAGCTGERGLAYTHRADAERLAAEYARLSEPPA